MNARMIGLMLVPLVLAGCNSHRKAPTTNTEQSGAAGAIPSGGETDPQATFIARFRQASEKKDFDQMLQLYCWDGVDAELRETVRGNVQDEFLQPVADLRIDSPPTGKFGATNEGGVRWKPNLPVIAVLKVRFSPAPMRKGLALSAAEYGLGLQDGQYRLVVNVREK
jgi:hypothetical protein